MPNSNSTITRSAARTVALFRKEQKGSPMLSVMGEGLTLRVGRGIEQDINQHPMSPRQVLVTRQEDLIEFGLQPGDLRENIVIEGLSNSDFVPGCVLHFHGGASIRLTFHCEPCKRIAHLVPSLSQLLLRRGLLGVVTVDGKINQDDTVISEKEVFEPLPISPMERFLSFLSQVPCGRVITYKDAIAGMGVAESYFRAIPGYINRAPHSYPVHRIVDSQGLLIPHVEKQKQKLEFEGVVFSNIENGQLNSLFDGIYDEENLARQVDLHTYRWCDPFIYTR